MKRIKSTHRRSLDLNRTYTQQAHSIKPTGLWYASGMQWVEYCNRSMPNHLGDNLFELKVDLSEVLIVKSFKDLKALHDRYGKPLFKGSQVQSIEWDKVSSDYKGIEIVNRSSLLRQIAFDLINYVWVSSLDVDSGCIWDLSAIQDHRLMNVSAKKYLEAKEKHDDWNNVRS